MFSGEDASAWASIGTEKQCARPDRVRRLYEHQLANPDYQRVIESNITIFGTIDGTSHKIGRRIVLHDSAVRF